MNQMNTLKSMRQTAILFASMCCTAVALAIATPVLAEDVRSLQVAYRTGSSNEVSRQA